jgi:hypothetical protein
MTFCAPCAPGRATSSHVYFGSTRSLCATCKRGVEAKIELEDDRVFLSKRCPEHGHARVLLASSAGWYLDALSFLVPTRPPRAPRPVASGCPFDCGPCASHQEQVFLPVVPITSACNLDCPICYTVNRDEDAFVLSREGFQATLDRLRAEHDDLDVINFTGGEPTLHPELPELLRMARRAGFRRLTVSTNGLRLADDAYVCELAAADARVVLSLGTLDDAVDRRLVGATTVKAKTRALELLARHDVTTTILPAVAAGLNDREVPALLDLVPRSPNVCSLELHTLAFTGQGGAGFPRDARITIPDLHRVLDEASGGRLCANDFVPSPLAHPHCYSIAYLLVLDGEDGGARPSLAGGWVPFTRFMSRAKLFELLADSLYLEPRESVERALADAIDEVWADPDRYPEAERILRTLKRLVRQMFPADGAISLDARRRIAERASKAVYIHAHMDEETFDVSRVMKCSVGVPEADGTSIPTCSYNVLYRERDPRFASPAAHPRALPVVR